MRPPRFAAEYRWSDHFFINPEKRFNEAAAIRGGIHINRWERDMGLSSFNEAAAIRGGILLRRPRAFGFSARFNEAAAIRGGIPGETIAA